MLAVAALGSGSSGNAILLKSRETTLLVDCGFTMKELVARMAGLGVSPTGIDGVLVSHEHGDHVKGAGPLSRRFDLPVYCTHGTWRQSRDNRFARVELFHAHEPFTIGDIIVDPFPTPHDAAESCQFVFESGGTRFATVTDLGMTTPHVKAKLAGINGLVVECNYDEHMLRTGPYPPSLQARIRSSYGHLGNVQAAELLAELDHAHLYHILLGHLSEKNNTGEVARETICATVRERQERIAVLSQHHASDWFELSAAPDRARAGSDRPGSDRAVVDSPASDRAESKRSAADDRTAAERAASVCV
ncbi:MAG: MBL fold metallo-hydrolase [Gammaproteobacteria bacterium]|nr:MAG: MBL fold metallo-hydrolase [Gammaproteobacteria bacterium]